MCSLPICIVSVLVTATESLSSASAHRINEETFWRNYFYRVSLIRQSSELSSLAQEGHDSKDSSRTSSVEAADPVKGQSSLQITPGSRLRRSQITSDGRIGAQETVCPRSDRRWRRPGRRPGQRGGGMTEMSRAALVMGPVSAPGPQWTHEIVS